MEDRGGGTSQLAWITGLLTLFGITVEASTPIAQATPAPVPESAAWVTIVLAGIGFLTLVVKLIAEDRDKRRQDAKERQSLIAENASLKSEYRVIQEARISEKEVLASVREDLAAEKERRIAAERMCEQGVCPFSVGGVARCHGEDQPKAIKPEEKF